MLLLSFRGISEAICRSRRSGGYLCRMWRGVEPDVDKLGQWQSGCARALSWLVFSLSTPPRMLGRNAYYRYTRHVLHAAFREGILAGSPNRNLLLIMKIMPCKTTSHHLGVNHRAWEKTVSCTPFLPRPPVNIDHRSGRLTEPETQQRTEINGPGV